MTKDQRKNIRSVLQLILTEIGPFSNFRGCSATFFSASLSPLSQPIENGATKSNFDYYENCIDQARVVVKSLV